ncbi:MAG TPA: hypothetical protein VFL07_14920 [Rudaea sp.]|nr:hypothetical protein [Rudaea sp.]
MATRSAKSTVGNAGDEIHADEIRANINGAQEEAAEDIDAIGDRLEALERQLRQAGDHLLENAKTLTTAASKQMQLHPLAAFGVAFLAGVTAARLLRR